MDDRHSANDSAWQSAVLAIYDGMVLAEHILSNGDASAEVTHALLDDAAIRFGVRS